MLKDLSNKSAKVIGSRTWAIANQRRQTRSWRRRSRQWLRRALIDLEYAEAVAEPARQRNPSADTKCFCGAVRWVAGYVRRERLVERRTVETAARDMVGGSRWWGAGDRGFIEFGIEDAIRRGLVATDCAGLLESPRLHLEDRDPSTFHFSGTDLYRVPADGITTLRHAGADDGALVIAVGRRRHVHMVVKSRHQGVLLEAVGNVALCRRQRLQPWALRRLRQLGWEQRASGAVYHRREVVTAEDWEANRALAIEILNTLADVYGCPEDACIIMRGETFGSPKEGVDWRERRRRRRFNVRRHHGAMRWVHDGGSVQRGKPVRWRARHFGSIRSQRNGGNSAHDVRLREEAKT